MQELLVAQLLGAELMTLAVYARAGTWALTWKVRDHVVHDLCMRAGIVTSTPRRRDYALAGKTVKPR